MSLAALVFAAAVTTAPNIPPVGARAQAYIDQKAGQDTELKKALEAHIRTVREMTEHSEDPETLGVLIRRLEQQEQCVEDLVGAQEGYRLTEGAIAEFIDRKQLMVDWLTAQGNLPAAVMEQQHEIKCAK